MVLNRMQIAKIIREDFLQQNAFSPYDYTCPLYKTTGMMRGIVTFFENAKKCINESLKSERKISWAIIQNSLEKQFLELSQMKFKDPSMSQEDFQKYFDDLCEQIDNEFRKLMLG